MSNKLDITRLKLMVKARFRISNYFESLKNEINLPKKEEKKQELEEEDEDDDEEEKVKEKEEPPKKQKSKPFVPNFQKFVVKTNLLRKHFLNLSMNELLKKEIEFSKKCDGTIKNLEQSQILAIKKLPKIKKRNEKQIMRIKLLNKLDKSKNFESTKIKNESKHSIFPYKKKLTTSNENIKHKKMMNYSHNFSKKNNLSCVFNNKNDFSIIKGGGIKYNCSIFRNKNISDFIIPIYKLSEVKKLKDKNFFK